MEDLESVKEYLSIIYGENYKVIMDKYVFVWENKTLLDEPIDGYIYTLSGRKLIEEKIDRAIELIHEDTRDSINSMNGTNNIDGIKSIDGIDGCALFMKGQLEEAYKIKYGQNPINMKVTILTTKNSLELGKLTIKYYSRFRPDIILRYNGVYRAIFQKNGKFLYFKSTQ